MIQCPMYAYHLQMLMLNESVLWSVNEESQKLLMNHQIRLRRTCSPCDFSMEMTSRDIVLL